MIRYMADTQAEEFARLGLVFAGLRGRPLQLIDCQNLFCEVDKYARAAHPEIAGISGRTRIKQAYRRDAAPLTAWFPPKWGLNRADPPADPCPPGSDGQARADGGFAAWCDPGSAVRLLAIPGSAQSASLKWVGVRPRRRCGSASRR